jgi:hypothetical protein
VNVHEAQRDEAHVSKRGGDRVRRRPLAARHTGSRCSRRGHQTHVGERSGRGGCR